MSALSGDAHRHSLSLCSVLSLGQKFHRAPHLFDYRLTARLPSQRASTMPSCSRDAGHRGAPLRAAAPSRHVPEAGRLGGRSRHLVQAPGKAGPLRIHDTL